MPVLVMIFLKCPHSIVMAPVCDHDIYIYIHIYLVLTMASIEIFHVRFSWDVDRLDPADGQGFNHVGSRCETHLRCTRSASMSYIYAVFCISLRFFAHVYIHIYI